MSGALPGPMMFLTFLKLLSVVVVVQGERKCYEGCGCVQNDPPYWSLTRLSRFPLDPPTINTTFLVYTRNNTEKYQIVSARNLSTFNQSYFDCSRPCTVFVIHGYLESGYDWWPTEMCKAILQFHDCNCISVDWKGGSFDLYDRAINNIQVVGGVIAYFINTTIETFGCSLNRTILIGHSLGGQVLNEVGKRQPGISKMYGPIGLGMKRSVGHVDLFPNGGQLMTGCSGSQFLDFNLTNGLVDAARYVALCNHVTSYYMLIASILTPGGFMGYCASSYDAFKQGEGFPCSNGNCYLLGFNPEPENISSCRTYYLNTGPRDNYPRWRFSLTVKTKGSTWAFLGTISVTLHSSSGSSYEYKMINISLVGGQVYSAFLDVPFPPPIVSVTFRWKSPLSLLFGPSLWAESVTLTSWIDGSVYKFCGGETKTLSPECP
ncbi:pancreatic lipase-related protein 2-like [Leptodactylus fuscus]|uniref:pancreatic lipase-related protein 2-like n=1 Tax=Leptodactylus fuscus TaxID=238119 RepID=UPI003F4E998B